ncbi:MAG: RNA 3'-terminal phosphate cyclase [Desulfobacterota bacterium]|nr:RNA 3'-terminal phosphate cyclase [Thermodesulfobacteriota bacterium]
MRPEGMVEIDGAYGEGGGQILRTALACSAILNRPVTVFRIRAGRKNPGLQAQHLKGIEALAEITRGKTEGVKIGSDRIVFIPGEITPGHYQFDIGTAGSVTLLLQSLLLPLCLCQGDSFLKLRGGTHVAWSPPFHYLTEILFPLLRKMGIGVDARIERWGWYPKGGGEVDVKVHPASSLTPLSLTDRGSLRRIYGLSASSHLPAHVAERQRGRALARLAEELGFKAEIEVRSDVPSPGQGSFLFLVCEFEGIKAGFSGLGRKGKRAEEVADEAVGELKDYLGSEGTADPHLADQIVPFMAFCSERSTLITTRVTDHLRTNLWVLEQFLDLSVSITEVGGGGGKIDLIPKAY